MKLFSTKKDGKTITHIHNGIGHSFCGHADDLDVLDKITGTSPTCKDCKNYVLKIVNIARRYRII